MFSPMQKADIAVPMTDIRYPGVKAGILNWPVSAVRLVGRSSQQMQNVANNILSAWRSYTDESVEHPGRDRRHAPQYRDADPALRRDRGLHP